MIVSIIKITAELPENTFSLKDKRRILNSLKEKTRNKFKVFVAETEHVDNLRICELGAAIVSNSKDFGEKILNKILNSIEDYSEIRIYSAEIFSNHY